MLSGLSVVTTLKVSRTQTSLMIWKPEPLARALPLTLQYLSLGELKPVSRTLVWWTSAQKLELSLSRILLPCTYMSSVTTNTLGRLLSVAD